MKNRIEFLINQLQIKSLQRRKTLIRSTGLVSVLSFLFIFTGCLQNSEDIDPDKLSNQQRIHQLRIKDAHIWNSMANQTIKLPTDKNTLTGSTEYLKMEEYPKGENYYFALFEDLFPSEGDYDFNDVMIKSKLGLSKKGSKVTGYLNSTLLNKGGSLPVEIGLMFYKEKGKTYTRIPNENIVVNDEVLTARGDPWSVPLNELGDSWTIDFSFILKSDNLWISYFIKTGKGEIMTSGFAPIQVEEFKLPHPAFITENNLPWGLEIETDKLAIPNEKELFLNAYPELEEWARSGGVKNKKWFESPDPNYTWNY